MQAGTADSDRFFNVCCLSGLKLLLIVIIQFGKYNNLAILAMLLWCHQSIKIIGFATLASSFRSLINLYIRRLAFSQIAQNATEKIIRKHICAICVFREKNKNVMHQPFLIARISLHICFLYESYQSKNIKSPFFIGVAGAGMSAIAQYLQGSGMAVSGSDRFFNEGKAGDIKEKLEAEGIQCYLQDGSGITSATDLVVASTAIEDTVIEIKKAKELGIPIIKRSELLSLIAASKKTIAVGGTSGKSTTTAMLFDIMTYAGLSPSIISGAGLVSLIKKEKSEMPLLEQAIGWLLRPTKAMVPLFNIIRQ
ncbi:Mur ligase domain-containing protein [Niabella ginsengisoli]|uniref:Mur ligase domain-containing protein n=1 Tax=Niabella ginsengisoli TaxID=522298 RepID=A0ABS9SQR9_9BACT|nr:Mur ligase domain-containing protein [Niabella ginsengisoli]MCH5600707.1 Mur ligase domain-containing protein [Niabella ginsengisoli]